MKLSGNPLQTEKLLLANIADSLNFIAWSKTKDAQKNKNKPKSILKELINSKKDKEIKGFKTGNEFDRARRELLRRGRYGS